MGIDVWSPSSLHTPPPPPHTHTHTHTHSSPLPPPTQPAKRRRSNHPSSSILSPPPVTPLLTPSHAQVSNIHAPVIVPNEKSVLTRNDSKAEGSKFFSFHQVRTRESSTELPPATSGSTSASSLLPKQVPHPQDSLQLQPRGGATTNREIPLPQLPTSGLQFGILSSKSQASTLGSLTFTVPPLRQASPPVSSSQQTLPGGGRGSGTEPPPPAAKFSPVFHASLSQVCTLVSASLTRKIINLSLLLPPSLPSHTGRW